MNFSLRILMLCVVLAAAAIQAFMLYVETEDLAKSCKKKAEKLEVLKTTQAVVTKRFQKAERSRENLSPQIEVLSTAVSKTRIALKNSIERQYSIENRPQDSIVIKETPVIPTLHLIQNYGGRDLNRIKSEKSLILSRRFLVHVPTELSSKVQIGIDCVDIYRNQNLENPERTDSFQSCQIPEGDSDIRIDVEYYPANGNKPSLLWTVKINGETKLERTIKPKEHFFAEMEFEQPSFVDETASPIVDPLPTLFSNRLGSRRETGIARLFWAESE